MTSIAAFLAYLLLLPAHLRLVVTNRALLEQAFRVLLDPDTGQLRPLDPQSCAAIERALQIVEAGLARAVWLFARQLARLPSAPPPSPLRTFAPRCGADAASLLLRAHALQVQLDTFHARALRLIHVLGWREWRSPTGYIPASYARILTQGNPTRGNSSRAARPAFAALANFVCCVHPVGVIRLREPPAPLEIPE